MANFLVPQKKHSADPVRIGSANLFITETDSDAEAATKSGFPAFAFLNNFKNDGNYKTLIDICYKSPKIYIINSTNDPARMAEMGMCLAKEGIAVFIVSLYDKTAVKHITLSDYLKTHSADDFKILVAKSQAFIEILIEQLPGNFLQSSSELREKIIPLLKKLDAATQKYFIDIICKKVKVKVPVIEKMLNSPTVNVGVTKESKEEKIDPKIQEAALILAHDAQLFRKRLDVVNRAGVVGERKVIALYFAAMDSRLIKENGIPGQNVLAIKSSGHFGAGKSFSLFNCLRFYPEEAIHLITSGSEKSIYYLTDGLKNKCLIVTEGFQFQGDRGDNEIVYVVRSLLSEGKIIRSVAEKSESGKIITINIVIEGPTSFITTTVVESLEPQLEDRMWSVHPDESAEQTKKIIHNTAEQRSGNIHQVSDHEIKVWKTVHRMMEPVSIVVPFAQAIAGYLTRSNDVPIAARRAFNKIMNVIGAIACLYQHQRPRDEFGNVQANIDDYWMAMQIVEESFRENLGQTSKITDDRLEYLKQIGHVSMKDLAANYGVSRSAISGWSKRAEEEGLVQWVDDNGNPFPDEKAEKKSKRSGKAHLMVIEQSGGYGVTGLPLPNDLMDPDPAWEPGGSEYEKFNLHLIPDIQKVGTISVPPTPLNNVFNFFASLKKDEPLGASPVEFIPADVSNSEEPYGKPPEGFSAEDQVLEPGDPGYINPLI